MTALQTPTDSVLRRHFESRLQTEWQDATPEDSVLSRHHEQMRTAWLDRSEQELPATSTGSTAASSAGRHPLALHLERRADTTPPVAVRRPPTARPVQKTMAVHPPEDSTLARHHAQMLDVSFAEHPLATHLRTKANATFGKDGGDSEASPVTSLPQGESKADATQPSPRNDEEQQRSPGPAHTSHSHSDRSQSTAQAQSPPSSATMANEGGWLRGLLRRITGGK